MSKGLSITVLALGAVVTMLGTAIVALGAASLSGNAKIEF